MTMTTTLTQAITRELRRFGFEANPDAFGSVVVAWETDDLNTGRGRDFRFINDLRQYGDFYRLMIRRPAPAPAPEPFSRWSLPGPSSYLDELQRTIEAHPGWQPDDVVLGALEAWLGCASIYDEAERMQREAFPEDRAEADREHAILQRAEEAAGR